jgi:acetolactate synthase regulatory subunit
MSMQKHQLQIQLRDGEGAVLRTIGLIERRGFRLDSLNLAEATAEGRTLQVSVSSVRPVDLLKRHLERLHDVLQVDIKQTAAKLAGTPAST